jgi:DNA-binding response OmpR family regulator
MMSSGSIVKKVLIVDTNPTITEIIKYTIHLQGIDHIVVAHDDAQGLELLFAELPDCIIIDVKLVRANEYQFLHALRNDARTANTPVIILSGTPREEDHLTDLLSETDEYLTKPFKPTALNAAIKRILE